MSKLHAATSAPPPAATHWQDLAGVYDPAMGRDPAMAALHRLILEHLPAPPGHVLDLGTGTGALLQLVRRRWPEARLTGLDPAPAMLEEAAAKLAGDPHLELILGSADDLELPSGCVDAVISNFALHHLPHPGKQRCAREVFRVLRPGGVFLFGDQHCRRMGTPDDPDWVREMLDQFSAKARHYLDTAGMERMLLQVKLLPRILTADGEVMATVDFWLDALAEAGFQDLEVLVAGPEPLLHRVIVARRSPA